MVPYFFFARIFEARAHASLNILRSPKDPAGYTWALVTGTGMMRAGFDGTEIRDQQVGMQSGGIGAFVNTPAFVVGVGGPADVITDVFAGSVPVLIPARGGGCGIARRGFSGCRRGGVVNPDGCRLFGRRRQRASIWSCLSGYFGGRGLLAAPVG